MGFESTEGEGSTLLVHAPDRVTRAQHGTVRAAGTRVLTERATAGSCLTLGCRARRSPADGRAADATGPPARVGARAPLADPLPPRASPLHHPRAAARAARAS